LSSDFSIRRVAPERGGRPHGQRSAEDIAKGLLDIMQEHLALVERTTAPLFLQLIELSKRYFVLWYAQGLIESAAPDDSDLEFASHATAGGIEVEIT
jgi:hypothetical protein